MPPTPPEQPPPRIGKYRIIRHLKAGGMGSVYHALDPEAGREVALKVLSAESASQPKRLERFRREAKQLARLRHENIVALFDFGEAEDGTLFLALEYIDGVDVEEMVRERGPLRPEVARDIVFQIARALDYAHHMGVVHRDIKPSNILVTERHGRYVAKLGDLGLARGGIEEFSRVTSDGATVGTVDYMPPEQAKDSGAADTRSDIYALGCTLYHLLTGAPPFSEGSLVERLMKHAKAEPGDLRELNPEVPDALWAVCRRMLAKKPSQRYQTPAELLADLATAGANLPPAIAPPTRRSAALPATMAEAQRPTPRPAGESSGEVARIAAGQFESAAQAVATGNFDYGLMLLLNCCGLEPGNLAYHQALRQAQRARADSRGLRPWRSWAGRLWLRLRLQLARYFRQPRRVLRCAEHLLICDPHDVETQRQMAEAARQAGFLDVAMWLLEEAQVTAPENVAVLRDLAEVLEQRRELPRALALWEWLAENHPADGEAHRKVRDLSASIATGKVSAGRKRDDSSRPSPGSTLTS
jgi:hypothetical protein